MIDPMIVPTPPAAETPPTKAAAIASVSKPRPAVVVAERKREAYIIPDRLDKKPMAAKTM